jgi:hypothetical protein
MKSKMKHLACAAILLSSASVALGGEPNRARVGDLPGFGEDAYFDDGQSFADYGSTTPPAADDVARATNNSAEETTVGVRQSSPAGGSVSYAGDYEPIGASELQRVGYDDGEVIQEYVDHGSFQNSHGPSCGCDNGCDSHCDGGCELRCRLRLPKVFDCNTWATYEALLWFPQSRDLPILVASAAPGELPILSPGGGPAAGVQTLFGGETDGGLSGGFRTDYGKWITKNVGIGGRFWWIGENSSSYSGTGLDGADSSVGIPYFEVDPSAPNGIGESALLISYLDNTSELTGDIAAESSLEMLAAEFYGRFRMGSSNCHQLDFIGGYSYFQIDDTLSLSGSNLVIQSPPLNPAPGTLRTFQDRMEAENQFHGGQLGFELSATRGCWMVRSLTKVHLGNMQQTYTGQGRSTNGIPGGTTDQFDNGFLVQDGNSGTFQRDKFAFAPEANFKLGYRFRPNVLLSVGYSFIYFDNVALAGGTVDRANNGPLFATGQSGSRPAFVANDDSLFVHGIDLGAIIDF